MKKLTILPLAALVLAACSESPLAPAFEGAPSFIAQHGAINAPAVTPTVSGSKVELKWTWSDGLDSWDLVSFKVTRDGVNVGASIQNAKPYAAPTVLSRTFDQTGVADGTYTYCVEVMAKYQAQSGPEVTKHNKSCAEVTVGAVDVYTITPTGGNAKRGTINGNTATFTLQYQFRLNGAVITDCTLVPTVTLSGDGAYHQHNCDPATGLRLVSFANPGSATQYLFAWVHNAQTIFTHQLTTN